MRRLLVFGFALVIGLVLVGAAASTVGAQNDPKDPVPVVPPMCEDMSKVDLNGDGKLNGADYTLWVVTVHESGRCELDAPVGNCPAWIDVNRDGIVSHADLEAMTSFLFECVYAPWRTRIN
jgi:hypothetical protein